MRKKELDYLKDYVTQTGEDGTNETVYIGTPYRYIRQDSATKENAWKLFLSAFAGAAFGIGELCGSGNPAYAIYAMAWPVLQFIALWHIADGGYTALSKKEPLHRRMADRLNNNLPAACTALTALGAATAVGGVVSIFSGTIPFGWRDAVFVLLALGSMFTGLYAARQAKCFRAEAVPAEEPAVEEKAEAVPAEEPAAEEKAEAAPSEEPAPEKAEEEPEQQD